MVRRRPPSVRSAKEGFDKSNRDAARVILQDVAKYDGPDSLMCQWARLVLSKAAPSDAECGPLFRAAAA